MTASTVKTTKLTAALVTEPHTPQLNGSTGGAVRVLSDTIEAATTSLDETGDIILTAIMLPSNAIVHSLRLYNDDLDSGGTSGAVDIGLYNGADKFVDGSTAYAAYGVVDVDAFASAVTTLTAANTAGTEIGHESNSAAGDLANIGKRLWDASGLAADPQKLFVVGITVTTAMTTPVAGTISLVCHYSV